MQDPTPNNKKLQPKGYQPYSYDPELDPRTSEERFKDAVEKLRPYVLSLWSAKWKLILINFSTFVLALIYLLFFTEPFYESTVSILPEYGSKSSTLSGLASLAGINLGEAAPSEIYENLINSESVMERVIYTKYETEKFDKPVNLFEYFEIKVDDNYPSELQQRKNFLSIYKSLTNGNIKTDIERMTKILTVTVTMPESKLSSDVANEVVASLDNYIRTKRKSYASEQRYYLEKRIEQVKDSLTITEEHLKKFREQNRVIAQSPQLLLEQSRLTRTVEILQAVYIELTKQLEIAKIDEIRDTPVINIKEEAKDPIQRAGPNRRKALLFVIFFSICSTVIFIAFTPKIKKYYKLIYE